MLQKLGSHTLNSLVSGIITFYKINCLTFTDINTFSLVLLLVVIENVISFLYEKITNQVSLLFRFKSCANPRPFNSTINISNGHSSLLKPGNLIHFPSHTSYAKYFLFFTYNRFKLII